MERFVSRLSLVRWMQEHFRLGIFTSATQRTVGNVLPLLEQAAGPGTPLFADPSLILHRSVGLPESVLLLAGSCAEQSMQPCTCCGDHLVDCPVAVLAKRKTQFSR